MHLFSGSLVIGELDLAIRAFAEHLDEVEPRVESLALVAADGVGRAAHVVAAVVRRA